MGRSKSRKIGQIGTPKSTAPVVRTPSERPKKKKGNKPGTRQQVAQEAENARRNTKKDPRIGSKTPVDLKRHLNIKLPVVEKQRVFSTPKAELDFIEADDKLQKLLDKQELGKLSTLESAYVEKTLARHKELCEMMGIVINNQEDDEEVDPLSAFESISIDDYKD